MASFFWLEPRKTGIQGLDIFLKDEQHNFGAQASNLPVDAGKASIADNIALNPITISFTAGVSNKLSLSGENNVKKTFEEIVKIWEAKTPIEIVTALKVYTKAIVTDVKAPYDGKGEYVTFEIICTVNDYINLDESGNLAKDDKRVEDPLLEPIKNKGGAF